MEVLDFHDITLVCDNNSSLWAQEVFPGITCISPKQVCQIKNIYVIVMVEDEEVYEMIYNQLNDLKIKDCCWIYDWLKHVKKDDF